MRIRLAQAIILTTGVNEPTFVRTIGLSAKRDGLDLSNIGTGANPVHPSDPKIVELLDKSCADALVSWWARQNRDPSQGRASVAIRNLQGKLNNFQKPNYDYDYFLTAYVLVYQIKHINMAWKSLALLNEERGQVSNLWDSLRIVDFGAGSSAGRIGAALMAAEAMKSGHNIERIYFDEIDISKPMLEMGKLVWKAFVDIVHNENIDNDLARAVEIFDCSQHVDWQKVGEKLDCETWLTAFHVIYQDQDRRKLKEVINGLYGWVNPIAGVFSCYYSSTRAGGNKNLTLMEEVFPPFDIPDTLIVPPRSEKCWSAHMSDWALKYGFITECSYSRGWSPFLYVGGYALRYGHNIPF